MRMVKVLSDGAKFTPVYDKCPKCGCDLKEWTDPFVNKVYTDQAKNRASETECSLKSSPKKSLARNFFNNCVSWMIFPFAAAKKYAAKRNQKR
ncbi:hypothetical protein [Klebsiella oxytoca]|uniref:hypothetical protein n=1 Tax=Klebsiella oxytoca TaxID=571 RepID=UPI002245E462|nr:hypothetical protein [Klebsiella oxytoca]MCW9547725.1 hypothetical protein [Klebsiella oxytoca]